MRILLIRKRHLALGGVLAVFLSVFAGLLWQGNAAFTDAFSAQEQPRVTAGRTAAPWRRTAQWRAG